jgi:hypothetical protein
MTDAAFQLLEQALRLSELERAELAARLLGSLPSGKDPESGAEQPMPWSEAQGLVQGLCDGDPEP